MLAGSNSVSAHGIRALLNDVPFSHTFWPIVPFGGGKTLDRYADLFSENLDVLISEADAAVFSSDINGNECESQ